MHTSAMLLYVIQPNNLKVFGSMKGHKQNNQNQLRLSMPEGDLPKSHYLVTGNFNRKCI
jgi:hypothetical protein